MKKSILIVGGLIIAAAAGAGGWYYYNNGGLENVSNQQQVYVTAVRTLMGTSSGVQNRYAGVVEPQDTVEVQIDSGRKVREVNVKTGEEVKKGQLLFEYDLSSIEEDLQKARLDLDRLKNEALSLSDQINTLEKEKKKATKDSQLSYTIEIETNKMNLKKNEYDQKSKQAEIEKLENATQNTEVRSSIDGVIQKIDTTKLSTGDDDMVTNTVTEESSYYNSSDNSNSAFITILSTGAYRIKGMVNELNMNSLVIGEPVIVRSRADENQTWRGTMGSIDMEHASSGSSNNMYFGMMDSSGDSQTSSSSYPFYVELDSSEGLMLGQHVYIELDEGQEDSKDGVWLSDFFIADADTSDPYVWVANDKNRLEKRSVILGNYDADLLEYEIVEGLSMDDCIAFPADGLEEGMPTDVGSSEQTLESMMNSYDDSYGEEMYSSEGGDMVPFSEDGTYDEFVVSEDYEGNEVIESDDMDDIEAEMEDSTGEEPEMIEGSGDIVIEDFTEDMAPVEDGTSEGESTE